MSSVVFFFSVCLSVIVLVSLWNFLFHRLIRVLFLHPFLFVYLYFSFSKYTLPFYVCLSVDASPLFVPFYHVPHTLNQHFTHPPTLLSHCASWGERGGEEAWCVTIGSTQLLNCGLSSTCHKNDFFRIRSHNFGVPGWEVFLLLSIVFGGDGIRGGRGGGDWCCFFILGKMKKGKMTNEVSNWRLGCLKIGFWCHWHGIWLTKNESKFIYNYVSGFGNP